MQCDEMATGHEIDMEAKERDGGEVDVPVRGPIAQAVAALGKHMSGMQEANHKALIEAMKQSAGAKRIRKNADGSWQTEAVGS